MSGWERFIFVTVLAAVQAYFTVLDARRTAEEEVPDEVAHARARRFRAAVERLRQQ